MLAPCRLYIRTTAPLEIFIRNTWVNHLDSFGLTILTIEGDCEISKLCKRIKPPLISAKCVAFCVYPYFFRHPNNVISSHMAIFCFRTVCLQFRLLWIDDTVELHSVVRLELWPSLQGPTLALDPGYPASRFCDR